MELWRVTLPLEGSHFVGLVAFGPEDTWDRGKIPEVKINKTHSAAARCRLCQVVARMGCEPSVRLAVLKTCSVFKLLLPALQDTSRIGEKTDESVWVADRSWGEGWRGRETGAEQRQWGKAMPPPPQAEKAGPLPQERSAGSSRPFMVKTPEKSALTLRE